ncbi:MAG: efflux RND transporter periplasmic adaptor subunit [Nitrospira sp.]|nr:efflux RND transporter periplasmic adaptor subunit [Candidatus Manganitrophaceae bacterium]HIL34721.1 efflux RND transporter periplasmic adaptor subunit [Candidatus Manganitrophaceae bacterium]
MSFFKKILLVVPFFTIAIVGINHYGADKIGINFLGISPKGSSSEGDAQRYKEVRVELGTFEEVVTADGTVIPINRIELKSKAGGRIIKLPVEAGDFVRKGDLIAKLDQRDEKSAVAQARADLDIARAELKQAKRMFTRRNTLYKRKIISEEERDETGLKLAVVKGKVIQALTKFDTAKETLAESIVRAPISGIILQKYVEEGQIIASGVSGADGGNPIVDIAAMVSVYIEAGINEIDIGKMEIGQSATIVAEAYPQLKFLGEVVRIAPEADPDEKSVTRFNIVVKVENADRKLKSGMNAEMELTLFKKDNILLAPVTAFKKIQGADAAPDERVVHLKQGNVFISRTISVGLSDFKEAEILSGLSEGDILGIPMTSRLNAANKRLEERIKRSRGFGVRKKK